MKAIIKACLLINPQGLQALKDAICKEQWLWAFDWSAMWDVMLCLNICTEMMLPFSCLLNLKLRAFIAISTLRLVPLKAPYKKKETGSGPAKAYVFISALVCHLESRLLAIIANFFLWTDLGSFPVSSFHQYVLKIYQRFLKLKNKIISVMNARSSFERTYNFLISNVLQIFPCYFYLGSPQNCNLCSYAEFLKSYFI